MNKEVLIDLWVYPNRPQKFSTAHHLTNVSAERVIQDWLAWPSAPPSSPWNVAIVFERGGVVKKVRTVNLGGSDFAAQSVEHSSQTVC